MFAEWWEWLRQYDQLLWWLGALSLVTLVASIFLVPVMLARMPETYFLHEHRQHRAPMRPSWFAPRRLLLNLLGGLLVVAGLAMLVLPGQGILMILIGLGLMEFPGKYRFERWLVRRPPVLKAVNWIRHRAGKPPLRMSSNEEVQRG